MKQNIPFKKDITFFTKIAEITSISLEHDYKINNGIIEGNFIISGDYKVHEASIEKENFNYKIPFDIDLTDKYDLDNATLEIDDFYYEIVNNNIMKCNIEVNINNLEFIKNEVDEEDDIEEIIFHEEIDDVLVSSDNRTNIEDIKENVEIIEDIKENIKMPSPIVNNNVDNIKSLFDNNVDEVFITYKIHIVKDDDTKESIMMKYQITEEIFNEYNDVENIKKNDKIIIPTTYE